MAPPNIRSAATAAAAADSPPPPPLPEKREVKRPALTTSLRTPSNSSIPTLSSASRLARQPSTSSSNATPPSRRPARSGIPPPSSRSALPIQTLDPSQDHHRSDSGRSTGSSRSTATTDSFFLPQHPHALHRRLKDLPPPPSPSGLADLTTHAKPIDAPSSVLGLNVSISHASGSSALPSPHLFRSKSSVSTTPTSPEEGGGSPLEPPANGDFPLLDGEEATRDDKLSSQKQDGLDDFWKSDYSYGRPSTDLLEPSLPPLMRSNAPIPPSRSQSLDPFAVPLEEHSAADTTVQRNLALEIEEQPTSSATPLVAANLRKLDSQHLQAKADTTSTAKLSAASSSPLLSPASTTQTPTNSREVNRLAVPRLSPYQLSSAAASSSSSAIDHRPQPNKSSSSLSTSSAHEADAGALASSSKRSSASSSSSFRMTLSRQAKTLRNSFMWSPPSTAQSAPKGQEHLKTSPALLSPDSFSGPISQGSSPGFSVGSPQSSGSELPRPSPQSESKQDVTSRTRSGLADQQPKASVPTNTSANSSARQSKPASLRSSHSSVDTRSVQSGFSNRPDARLDSTASRSSAPQSPKQQPTDYSKLQERPKSRLSSRLGLQNTHWPMKITNLKSKKAADSTAAHPATSQTTAEAVLRSSGRRSKSNASSSTAGTASSTTPTSSSIQTASATRASKRPTSLVIPTSPLLTANQSSTDSQISPSFAETFAFLNSHIDSPDQSPPLLATVLPTPQDLKAAVQKVKTPTEQVKAVVISATAPGSGSRRQQAEATGTVRSKILPKPAATTPILHRSGSRNGSEEARPSKEALFAHLADSPEAVYKTLVLPDPDPEPLTLPASQSLDSIAPNSSRFGRKFGHKKQTSLGSATLISKSARKAAAEMDKRASGAPVALSASALTNGRISTRSSFSSILPAFTPVDEESRFFDALTSPMNEHPPAGEATPSADDSVMPSFATATDFFSHTSTEPTSPVFDRPFASQSTSSFAAATSSSPQPPRTSLGRRLSGVFDPAKARSVRKNLLASPPQSPRADSAARLETLPARPETSLGFHLRNPLRRDRKASLTKAPSAPLAGPAALRTESAASTRTMSPASAIRKMSSGFKLDRAAPANSGSERPGTSLGFATSRTKTPRGFSSSFMAPTKSSLARSVQPSPPSAGKFTSRSISASSLETPPSNRQSRSPQRPLNPPSSFRGAAPASSRPSVLTNNTSSKTTGAVAKAGSSDSRAPPLSSDASRSSSLPLDSAFSPQDSAISGSTTLQTSKVADADTAAEPTTSEVRRRRTLSKPVLRPIRTSFAEEVALARPSTAMGFRGPMTVQDRKMSQPTLDMVDDREFLEALEQVRAVHRERIQAQAQEVENKTRLARLGMMSGNYLKTKVSGSMLDDETTVKGGVATSADRSANGNAAGVWADASKAIAAAGSRLRHKRSASADAKLGRSRSISSASRESEGEVDQRQKDIVRAYADKKSPAGPLATGLEWGVGKASGKLHDGTFVNDDDWKKEVKALFLIRELVQTERSYARHLSSLLSVVRKMQIAPTGSSNALGVKRKSTSNLFAAYSSAYSSKSSTSSTPPSHVTLLRTYLPQLIALSNALVQRVEENPTSAGVGAAFDVLSAQLESTFVGWSTVAPQVLKELRTTESTKGKSPFKIGLVPLTPREATEVGASTTDASNSSGASSPGSGFRHSTLRMTSFTRPASPVKAQHESDAPSLDDDTGSTLPVKRSTKRRSTITSTSFIPPRVTVAPAAPVITTSPEEDKSPDALRTSDTTSSRRYAHSRSQSTLVTPLPTPTSSIGPEPWSGLSMTSSVTSASNTLASQSQPAGGTAKCLTPMDIAIMPTQRIPRYGLMLRDLLRNTPPESLSHARVQRAIGLIQKVALLCDSAAPVVSVAAPASGAATPSRASSVLGMTAINAESTSMHTSPLLTSSAFSLTKRN